MTARDRLRDARAELQRLVYFAESERCKWAYWLYDAIDSLEEAENEAEAQREDPPEQPPAATPENKDATP